MASKIQLRRDLAASWENINPILAQGEPGAELDTGKMKLGDGVTPWNQLPYTSSNDYEDKFVFLFSGGNYYAAGTSTSRDGLHWTGTDVNSEFWEGYYGISYAYDLAVGNGRVAYLVQNYGLGLNLVMYSETPGSALVDPNITRFLEDEGANIQRSWVSSQDLYEYLFNDSNNYNWVTVFGPHGESISWQGIKFQGGYFIAYGSYIDSVINDGLDRPYWAYSTDAVHWTRGYVDLTFVSNKMSAYASTYNNNTNSYVIRGVNYNGHGWLFTMKYWWDSIDNDTSTGAFYLTDLSNQGLTSDTWFPMNGAYSMNFDGQGWGGYMGDGRMIFNSNTDPRVGGWREVNVSDAQQEVWGDQASTSWNGSLAFVAGPLADGTPMFMVSLNNGRVLTTTNQGASFYGSTPAARVDSIQSFNSNNPFQITTYNENNSGNTGIQQVVITGSLNGQADGTFFAQQTDTNFYTLYHDYNLSYPVNGTTWTNGSLFNDAYITFTQDGIRFDYLTYGGGKFVAFSNDCANNYMTEDGVNWKYGFGWNVVYSFDIGSVRIAYGRVSTDGQIVVSDETFPGRANSLTLGNNFDVQVNSGDPLSASTDNYGDGLDLSDGTGYLSIRPYNAQWRIGAYGRSSDGPNPYSFLGSDDYYDYFDGPDYSGEPAAFPGGPDIRLTTYWDDWYFTSDPGQNYSQLIIPYSADIVNTDQESFLKDIPRNNQGSGTSYTLALTDRGRFIWFDGTAGNVTVTIPASGDASFPIGTRIEIGISGVTSSSTWVLVIPAGGVTLRGREDNNSPNSGTLIIRSDMLATLTQVDTDFWILSGPYITD